jgi:hypothetical protein
LSQFEHTSEAIVASVQAGASIEEAALHSGVPVATVRRWLRDGRKSPQGRCGAFASAVDEARASRKTAERALEAPLDPAEAELLLATAARKGSVPALRLWFEQRAASESAKQGAGARELLEKVFADD